MPYPPPLPWQPWQPWQGPGNPSMLASHSDRERAVDVLRAAFGEGRLQQHEFEQRVAKVHASRTIGELSSLVADLPQGPAPMPHGPLPMPQGPVAMAPVPRMAYPPARQVNGKATASLTLGLLTLFTFGATGIPAAILGHQALGELRGTEQNGDAQALIGVALGWLSIVGWVLMLVVLVVM